MLLALTNSSTYAGLDTPTLMAIAAACTKQLAEFCPLFGLLGSSVVVRAPGAPGAPCDAELALFDTSDQAGDLGYHSEAPSGVPYGRIFVNDTLAANQKLTEDAMSVSCVVSHEALELVGDPGANRWSRSQDGRFWAWEVCDPVEGQTYSLDGVAVSNYVTPAWFDYVQTKGPFDRMASCSAAFEVASGGYAIIVGTDGKPSTLGAHARAHVPSKHHEASRTWKRLHA